MPLGRAPELSWAELVSKSFRLSATIDLGLVAEAELFTGEVLPQAGGTCLLGEVSMDAAPMLAATQDNDGDIVNDSCPPLP